MNSIIHNAPRGIAVPRDVARPSASLPDPLNVAPVSRARMCERVPLECCGGLQNVDLSKMDVSLVGDFLRHVDLQDSSFCIAVAAIAFNPLFWNTMARWEHRTRRLSRLVGSPSLACYCLGFVIILLDVYRSHSGSSPVGLVLTAIVGVAYKLAIMFEGPFTQKIYQERRKQE
uniref:Phosphatidylethanolamine N-methyltransferase n=1 Tax=Oryzias latipes TaxID=8090 RepID=A0A3P9HMR3_ORYLA